LRVARIGQREQTLTIQSFLRDWYGISYQPKLTPDGEAGIDILEAAERAHSSIEEEGASFLLVFV
jgi:hypothetical protein